MIQSHRQCKEDFILTTGPLLISTTQMKVKNNAILILKVMRNRNSNSIMNYDPSMQCLKVNNVGILHCISLCRE